MNLEQSPHRIFESAESDLLPMLMRSAFRQALETSIDLNASKTHGIYALDSHTQQLTAAWQTGVDLGQAGFEPAGTISRKT